jgi:hypothetical protein
MSASKRVAVCPGLSPALLRVLVRQQFVEEDEAKLQRSEHEPARPRRDEKQYYKRSHCQQQQEDRPA